ncbi:MAG: porin family protein [Bacteroidales bacterium]
MTRLILALAFFTVLGNLNAQGLEISVYTGPQLAWITSDEEWVSANGSLINFNSGIEFDIFFMPNYALTLAVEINNQGGKFFYSDTTRFQQTPSDLLIPGGSHLKHNLQYIGAPIGLKLKTAELGYTTFYFHGGFNPLFNLKAVTSSEQLSLMRDNIKPDINTFSLNFFVSAGIEYRLAGNTALMAGLKWSSGFSDVTKNDMANNNLKSVGLHLGILF